MTTLNNANINQEQSAILLAAFNGEQFPYADAMEEVYVPVANIEIFDGENIATENGTAKYTHIMNFMTEHPNMPANVGRSLKLVDFRSRRIMLNLGFVGDEQGFMQACMPNMMSEVPDCAYARVYICWRTVGENYQRRSAKGQDPRMTFTANESGEYKVGDVRPFYELAPSNELTLPSWFQQARMKARLEATMSVEMENVRAQQQSFFAKRNNILNTPTRKTQAPANDSRLSPQDIIQSELDKLNEQRKLAKGDDLKTIKEAIAAKEVELASFND